MIEVSLPTLSIILISLAHDLLIIGKIVYQRSSNNVRVVCGNLIAYYANTIVYSMNKAAHLSSVIYHYSILKGSVPSIEVC